MPGETTISRAREWDEMEPTCSPTSARRPRQFAVIQRFVARPETLVRFDKDGLEPVGNGPLEFGAQVNQELAQWRELAKTTKITVD